MEEAMILLENCELGEDRQRKEGEEKKKKENNAGVFHCIGEVERDTGNQ